MTKCKGPCWNCSKCKKEGNPSGILLSFEIPNINKFDGLEELFCDDCDAVYVYPEKPETGKFFSKMGHVLSKPSVQYKKVEDNKLVLQPKKRTLGECVEVVWALCSKCSQKKVGL